MQILTHLSWETVAVAFAIAYIVLAVRENILCWYCAFVSSLIFTVVFWNVSLLMESVLNVYYVAMAVYGWYQWKRGGADHRGRQVHRWALPRHLAFVAAVLVVSTLSGWLLGRYTNAALPYLDSFTTWGSVFVTVLVARKVLENWIYWIVIDLVSMYLYWDRGLYQTLVLFLVYTVLAVFGYFHWKKILREQTSA